MYDKDAIYSAILLILLKYYIMAAALQNTLIRL